MSVKIFQEGLNLVVDSTQATHGYKKITKTFTNQFRLGFFGQTCWIAKKRPEIGGLRYLFNGKISDMANVDGTPFSDKDTVADYLIQISGSEVPV